MAPSVLLAAAMALALLCSATATDYTVGAPGGSWDLSTNYASWVASKSFKVGDTLVFSYSPSLHNVVEVSKADYDSCSATTPIKTYTDGSTKIDLTSAGTRYFICGITGHCAAGMKVAVSVAATSPSSPKATPPAATPSAPTTPPSVAAKPPAKSAPETPKTVADAPNSGAASASKAVAALAVGVAMVAMAL